MMWSLLAGCGLALVLLVTGAEGQTPTFGTCQTTGQNEVCLACQPPLVLDAGTCKSAATSSCPANCAACPGNNTVCQTCNPGFRLKGAACERCLAANCKVCHATCIDRCEECLEGFRRNGDYNCERCNGLCKNCSSSAASCDECGPATYADSSATCGACTDTVRCAVCTSPSICVQCRPGNFLSGTTCSGCTGGCLACTSASTCSQCPAGQYWDTSGTNPTCTACHAQCKTNKCDLRNKCTECNDGYFLSGGSCIQRTNCMTPATDGKCDVCNDGFKKLADGTCESCLDLTQKECHMCVDGNRRRLWKNGQCDYCPTNCDKCNTTTNCQSCMPNFVWNTTTSKCEDCPTTDSSLIVDECARCFTSYWDSSCKACPGANPSGATQAACENCKGVTWTQNCTSCVAGSLPSTMAECNQCAAAKTGIYWMTSSCMQRNCTFEKTTEAACDSCGVSNLLVQCRECPSNSSLLSTAECEQCNNFKLVGSSCLDTTTVDCTGNLTSNDEATCLYCGSHYWDNTTMTCKICPASPDMETCPKCPGRYLSGSTCETVTPQFCSTAPDTTPEAMCNGCNVYGKYWSGVNCTDTDCSTTPSTRELCDACNGFMWNGTECLSATAGLITDQEACRFFSGRKWDSSMCTSIIAMAGQNVDAAVTAGNAQIPQLYRSLSSTTYAPAVCNEFDTAEECSRCTGQYWDSMTMKCKAVDCTNPTTADNCNACPKRYWSTSCQTVSTCSTSLGTQAECEACRFDNYYWDGACKQSACVTSMLEGSTTRQSECQACEGVYWNGTECFAATSGNFTHSEEICEGFFARVFVNDTCLFVTSRVGEMIDPAISAGNGATNPFMILGDRYFIDDGTVYRLPDPTGAATYEIAESWCRYGASKYGLNRYWESTILDSFCIDVAATPSPNYCGTSTAAENFRNANPTLCGKCPGYLWDTTAFKCNAVNCNTLSLIKTEADCTACGQGFVWENYIRLGNRCKRLTCGSDLLGSTARCTACSVQNSPMYLQSSSDCYACPTANCLRCDVQGCTKCNYGFVLDTTAGTCTACTGSQVFDPTTQMCKTCPANCRLCSSASVCTDCKDGFIVRAGSCVSCVQTEADCNDCKSPINGRGSRWDANASPQCIACPAACSVCTPTGCSTCLDGFYVSSGSCKSCKAPKLTAEAQCQKCFPETYFATGSGCVDCPVENCKTCSATDKCTACVEGRYFKSSTMKCELCSMIDANCLTCTNDGDCTKCGGGTYRYNNTKSCVTQDANCITQKDDAGCTLCKDGYYITGATCTLCQPGCAKCTDGSTCTMCQANYFMTPRRMCARCIDNCDVCECNAKCDRCATGFCFDVNNLECISNSKNCKDCTKDAAGVVSCINCAENFVKDVCPACTDSNCIQCNAINTCQKCRTGYRLDSNTCTACTDTNCAVCDTAVATCASCKDNYFDNNGTCTRCGSNCKSCFNATSCNECFGGYTLSGGACTPCTPSCTDCRPECQTCADSAYVPDPVTKQCVPRTTTTSIPTTTTSNSPPSHQMALATLLMALIMVTMTII